VENAGETSNDFNFFPGVIPPDLREGREGEGKENDGSGEEGVGGRVASVLGG